MTRRPGGTRHIGVVGGGIVGLSTAWFLQEQGACVTVYDGSGIGSGSSWGNAGWVTPGLSAPLPEPAVLHYGLRALARPASPLYVPPTTDRQLLSFLARFAFNSTTHRWRRGMDALVPINRMALGAFETLTEYGVEGECHEARPFLAAYQRPEDQKSLLAEITHLHKAGQTLEYDTLTGDEARAIEPALSERVAAAIRLHGQKYVNPGSFVQHLARAVEQRGGVLNVGSTVHEVGGRSAGATVRFHGHDDAHFDDVIIATGARLGELSKRLGVRTLVQAGRGYSFSCTAEHLPGGPIYFPTQRVACTPIGGRLRIAGMMEFRKPDAPLDLRRVEAISRAAQPLLQGIDFSNRIDEWVGSRPVTPDGLPLIGRTRAPSIYVAGGHGMWGVTLGPATGKLLAEMVMSGVAAPELVPFDPLR